jgi:hypothetical protein
MSKDLTNSKVDRQNILNNSFALQEIQKAANITGVMFEGSIKLTKEQIALFFDVDIRTIERYLESYMDELGSNGYEVLKGQKLKSFREEIKAQFVTDIDIGSKVRNLGVFDFRSLLNIAMLLTESETDRVLRQTILDIVIDTINKRTGGGIKYINHCFEDGNKRIAISLGAQFLLLNGYIFTVSRFIVEMENVSYNLAAGLIDKDFLQEIVTAIINDDIDDESLKLKIFNEISQELPTDGFE